MRNKTLSWPSKWKWSLYACVAEILFWSLMVNFDAFAKSKIYDDLCWTLHRPLVPLIAPILGRFSNEDWRLEAVMIAVFLSYAASVGFLAGSLVDVWANRKMKERTAC